MASTDGLYTYLGGGQWAENVQLMGNNALRVVAVTPSDAVALVDGVTKGLYVGGAGNISLLMADGTSATFNAIAIGVIHPLGVKRVNATGTTATNILAVY